MDVVGFPLEGGGQVLVRVEDASLGTTGVVTRGGTIDERLVEAQCTFQAALEPVRAIAEAVLERLAAVDRPPDEIRVEFGLELSAKAGAIVTATGSAALNVALTWRRPTTGSGDPGP
jgi:hypothetical protein